jgi:hypothetical protein
VSPIKLESYRDRPFNLQDGGLWFFIKKKFDFQSYRKKYAGIFNTHSIDFIKILNIKLRLCDQFKQKWSTVVFNSPKCLNYRIFKCNHGL